MRLAFFIVFPFFINISISFSQLNFDEKTKEFIFKIYPKSKLSNQFLRTDSLPVIDSIELTNLCNDLDIDSSRRIRLNGTLYNNSAGTFKTNYKPDYMISSGTYANFSAFNIPLQMEAIHNMINHESSFSNNINFKINFDVKSYIERQKFQEQLNADIKKQLLKEIIKDIKKNSTITDPKDLLKELNSIDIQSIENKLILRTILKQTFPFMDSIEFDKNYSLIEKMDSINIKYPQNTLYDSLNKYNTLNKEWQQGNIISDIHKEDIDQNLKKLNSFKNIIDKIESNKILSSIYEKYVAISRDNVSSRGDLLQHSIKKNQKLSLKSIGTLDKLNFGNFSYHLSPISINNMLINGLQLSTKNQVSMDVLFSTPSDQTINKALNTNSITNNINIMANGLNLKYLKNNFETRVSYFLIQKQENSESQSTKKAYTLFSYFIKFNSKTIENQFEFSKINESTNSNYNYLSFSNLETTAAFRNETKLNLSKNISLSNQISYIGNDFNNPTNLYLQKGIQEKLSCQTTIINKIKTTTSFLIRFSNNRYSTTTLKTLNNDIKYKINSKNELQNKTIYSIRSSDIRENIVDNVNFFSQLSYIRKQKIKGGQLYGTLSTSINRNSFSINDSANESGHFFSNFLSTSIVKSNYSLTGSASLNYEVEKNSTDYFLQINLINDINKSIKLNNSVGLQYKQLYNVNIQSSITIINKKSKISTGSNFGINCSELYVGPFFNFEYFFNI